MKKVLLASIMSLSMFAAYAQAEEASVPAAQPTAEQKAELKSDRVAATAACQEEAKIAGCSDKVVGKGMLKCIHQYKKSHKDFKIGDGCKAAGKELRKDRKAYKGKKHS